MQCHSTSGPNYTKSPITSDEIFSNIPQNFLDSFLHVAVTHIKHTNSNGNENITTSFFQVPQIRPLADI